MPTIRPVVACALLGAALSSCSGDGGDAGAGTESATVHGVFTTASGSAMPGATVKVSLWDTSSAAFVDSLVVPTDVRGRFHAHFTFDQPTLPVRMALEGRPALGSGMSMAFDYGRVLQLPPGQAEAALRSDLTSYQATSSVIGLRAASLAREAVTGHYSGYSVQPYYDFYSGGYLEFTFSPGTGEVSGTFAFEYNATILGGVGGAIGRIQHDTLYLQLNEIGGPRTPPRAGSFRVIATSPAADTLVAWPDPCAESCILTEAPVRLVRMP